jgi:hypothetical protein
MTVRLAVRLETPFTVTTTGTGPLLATPKPLRLILDALQLEGVTEAPPNVTVLFPWFVPKFDPAIVKEETPIAAGFGEREVIPGCAVKVTPLLFAPPTVTTTGPVVAPDGTATVTEVPLQLLTLAVAPANETLLLPCVVPKPEPVIVTTVPVLPDVGLRLVRLNADTVKLTPLLATPPTVTTILPVVAPEGTGTQISVSLQFVGVAEVPLNLTVLDPCVAPNPAPVIITDAPTPPDVGERLVMPGPGLTVKATPLLGPPDAVTTTLPVVAPSGTVVVIFVELQVTGVACVPLNDTVFVPWDDPKLLPLIVTGSPFWPDVGDRLVMFGLGSTVKLDPLLAIPSTLTTTSPVVAPLGTSTSRELALQLLTVVTAVPLNVIVLVPWALPKFDPLMITSAPTAPWFGDTLLMLGAESIVKLTPLLATLETVITMFPVVVPVGTGAVMLVEFHAVGVAVVPLNAIVLEPCEEPKPVPLTATEVPTTPEVGEIDEICGPAWTVKDTPFDGVELPLAVTTTFPVVAPTGGVVTICVSLQEVGLAAVPLNVTVPVTLPNPLPLIWTDVATVPEFGDRLVIFGFTVKFAKLLGGVVPSPRPALTKMLPVSVPVGTGTTMLVSLQLVGLALPVPENVTEPNPWLAPKFIPLIVIDVPIVAAAGETLVIVGSIVNSKLSLVIPATVTDKSPKDAPLGTGTTIVVGLQLLGVATVPLNSTVLVPWVEPKFVPVIVTGVPATPDVGETEETESAGTAVNTELLLKTPPTSTTTLAVDCIAGVVKTIELLLQLEACTPAPPNWRALELWVAPKLLPLTVTATGLPIATVEGERLVITGPFAFTVKFRPALAEPTTVTTTLPLVAPVGTGVTIWFEDQPTGLAAVPLNVTVLLPWVAPKFDPEIVTVVPTTPALGDRFVKAGVVPTANELGLLEIPETVTKTLPDAAPFGTATTMLVELQLVAVAFVPSNDTVLVPWLEPKFVPVTVTGVPKVPDVGDRLEIAGGCNTLNIVPLLCTPPAVTTTLPVVAPLGTVTTMRHAPQLVTFAVVPLKATVLVPCVAPKFVPVILTVVPTAPEDGDKSVTLGVIGTVKATRLLLPPFVWTSTLPVVAAAGTGTTICVALQLVGVATAPLKVIVLEPWLEPKFKPVIVTAVPAEPVVGDMLLMFGGSRTVNAVPLLSTPLANTTTLPLLAPDGTGTTMDVALQLVGDPSVPLKVTAPLPWVLPKLLPLIVTDSPTGPEVDDKLVMLGVPTTVKLFPLLFTPLACTTTFPVVAPEGTVVAMLVALQLVAVAPVPLKLTVLLPWVDPKLLPAIVTDAPTAPEVGDKLLMLGAETTVKDSPLLDLLDTVTTTFPVVAPLGTVATMLVALQLVAVAVLPLNLTVLDPWLDPKFVPVIVTEAPTAPEVGERLVMVGDAARAGSAKGTRTTNARRIRIGPNDFRHMNAASPVPAVPEPKSESY